MLARSTLLSADAARTRRRLSPRCGTRTACAVYGATAEAAEPAEAAPAVRTRFCLDRGALPGPYSVEFGSVPPRQLAGRALAPGPVAWRPNFAALTLTPASVSRGRLAHQVARRRRGLWVGRRRLRQSTKRHERRRVRALLFAFLLMPHCFSRAPPAAAARAAAARALQRAPSAASLSSSQYACVAAQLFFVHATPSGSCSWRC